MLYMLYLPSMLSSSDDPRHYFECNSPLLHSFPSMLVFFSGVH